MVREGEGECNRGVESPFVLFLYLMCVVCGLVRLVC